MIPEDRALLPADYVAHYAANPPPSSNVLPGVLPPVALHHYTTGGCWILALALAGATGLPIEVGLRDGRPRHAYVADDSVDCALDGFGRRTLRLARAGFDSVERVTRTDLVALLREQPTGPSLLADIKRPESWEAAQRAAEYVSQRPDEIGDP